MNLGMSGTASAEVDCIGSAEGSSETEDIGASRVWVQGPGGQGAMLFHPQRNI